MHSVVKLTFILLTAMSLFSCAKTDDEAVKSAIREARYFLTSSNCDNAIDILDDVGTQSDNAAYVSVYASAIACSSGYTELGTALGNLTSIDTSNQGAGLGFIKSFAGFPSSNETAADEETYTKILEAIRYILEADSAQPSTTGRLSNFGTKAGNDLSMQALLMTTVALGKWFAYYGDADASGTKGAGGNNACIFSYTNANAVSYVNDASPSGCVATGTEGHVDLESPVTDETIKRRMCEGIYLFNNLVDIISFIDLSSNPVLGSLSSMGTLFNNVISAAETIESTSYNSTFANSVTAVKSVTSMNACDALDINQIQKFYAILLETLF